MKLKFTVLAMTLIAGPVLAAEGHSSATPAAALDLLTKGNQRYVLAKSLHPHQSKTYRVALTKGQHPFAAVLSCADSRVPPEIVFDEGLGDLFVVRVAGNVVDDAITGSLEYAAEHLHVPLIVVLGHTKCGAVQATIDGGEPNTHIQSLVDAIKPAVEQASHEKGTLADNAVRDNVLLAVKQLRESKPILQKMQSEGKIRIIGAVYNLEKGTVEYIE